VRQVCGNAFQSTLWSCKPTSLSKAEQIRAAASAPSIDTFCQILALVNQVQLAIPQCCYIRVFARVYLLLRSNFLPECEIWNSLLVGSLTCCAALHCHRFCSMPRTMIATTRDMQCANSSSHTVMATRQHAGSQLEPPGPAAPTCAEASKAPSWCQEWTGSVRCTGSCPMPAE
jgi:hypothetical protein